MNPTHKAGQDAAGSGSTAWDGAGGESFWATIPSAAWLSMLIVMDSLMGLRLSSKNPLWHDELFTYVIAQAPSLHAMYAQINATDMNPPLSYLLTRLSFHLFGVGTLQCRLPEMAGFLLALICLYAFVSRRLNAVYGFLAGAVFLGSEAVAISYQARPYGLLLGWTALSLLTWHGAQDAKAKIRAIGYDLLLFAAVCLLLVTHVFGVIAWGALLAAEAAQALRARRINPGRALALLLPAACVVLYRPFFQLHAHTVYPLAFQPTGATILQFYMDQVQMALFSLLLTVLLLFLLRRSAWLQGDKQGIFSLVTWISLAVLTVAPAVLMLRLMLSHGAFFPRYGVLCTLAIAIGVTAFVFWWAQGRRSVALLLALVILVLSRRLPAVAESLLHVGSLRQTEPTVALSHLQSLTDPTLPIVDASGLTFVEMNFREPSSLLSRVFYLTDQAAAVQYAHATIFEIMQVEKDSFHFKGQVESYPDFIQQHPHFYVLGSVDHPEDWLLRKLLASHAQLRLIAEDSTSYKDAQIYEVWLNPAQTQAR